MTAPGSEDKLRPQVESVPTEDAGTAGRRMRALRLIAITCAALFGALLSGLVASIQGFVALVVFTFRLGRVGFFKHWMIAATYAGRSLIVLIIVALVSVTMGAVAWSVGVLTWSVIADPTSRVRVTLDTIWRRLRPCGCNDDSGAGCSQL